VPDDVLPQPPAVSLQGEGDTPRDADEVFGFDCTLRLDAAGFVASVLPLRKIERALLALALVGLGAGVNIKKMRSLGSRPLLLGTLSYVLVLVVSLVTIRFIPLTL
jgi:uncharacterized membrane protein YadS